MAFSPGPPRTQTAAPSAVKPPSERAKPPVVQRFEGPTAPGASATIGRSSVRPRRIRQAAISVAGTLEFRQRPVGRLRGAARQRQHGAAIDHAGQLLLPEAHVVEQDETHFAGKAHALRNAGQKRRQRRLPGARHGQRHAIAFSLEPSGEGGLLRQRQPAARQVGDNRLPDARHVVGKGRTERRRQKIDRPIRESAGAAPSPPNGSARNRRSTYTARSGSDACPSRLRASRRSRPQLCANRLFIKYELMIHLLLFMRGRLSLAGPACPVPPRGTSITQARSVAPRNGLGQNGDGRVNLKR